MDEEERPKKPPPPDAVAPRVVAEGVARGLNEIAQPIVTPYGEDMIREIREAIPRHHEGACELGNYNEAEDRSAPGRLRGTPRPIAFESDYWAFFNALSPEKRRLLLALLDWLVRDEKRLPALVAIVNHRIDHGIIVSNRWRLWRAGGALLLTTWGFVVWGGNALEWIVSKIPLAETIFHFLRGLSS